MNARSRRATAAFWVCAVVGWTVIALGVRGIFVDRSATRPSDLVRWFGGLLVLHDAVLVPVALGVGWLVGRLIPARASAYVKVGGAMTATVIALWWPLWRGYGRRESNPTLLRLPYERNLLVALALGWGLVSAVALVAAIARRVRR
jgi:hypothetical protein